MFIKQMIKDLDGRRYFILDHGKKVNGVLKYEDHATTYGWNIHKYNKVRVGDVVLFRHTGKHTKDRKFEIYAGGVIESITAPDPEGYVVASISRLFEIQPAIRQGDSRIEEFVWESKTKKPGSWEHFFNQYGMNMISISDFTRLLDGVNCVPMSENDDQPDLSKEIIEELKADADNEFSVEVVPCGPSKAFRSKEFAFKGKKIDYDKVQKAKNRIGRLGELIVLDILKKKALETAGGKLPIHVSVVEGDHLGYDIRAFETDGTEIHIEVKTTTGRNEDGFELTRNEMLASMDTKYKYYIYRVFNLDVKSKSCKLVVFEGPITDANYNLVGKIFNVYKK